MDWQPIETAPKDGTHILFWDGDGMSVCYWVGRRWDLVQTGAYAEDADCWPTHWMPLPEPPKE
jgi:hypothetical protein